MAMTRAQLRRAAIIAQCKAAKDKPLERRRVKSFMEPITKAFASILQGSVEVDDNNTPITRLPHVASDLRKGKLMTVAKARKAWETLQIIEDRMTRCTWNEVSNAVDTTRIEIEFERLGMKEAA